MITTAPPGLGLPPSYHHPLQVSAAHGPRLPMDLWPDIVSHLSFDTLDRVTLVCQYFRKLAQPLLFRTLVVKPFAFNPKTRKTSPRSRDYQKWIFMKLAFYSIPRIAASVKTCDVKPQEIFVDSLTSEIVDPGRAIINAAFEMLVQFPGLSDISVTMVVFIDNNLAQLSRLSTLSSLVLMCCKSSAAAPLRITAKNFVFRQDMRRGRVVEEGVHILLSSMVIPSEIESLSLMGRTTQELLEHLPHSAVFSKLHTLCLDPSAISSPYLPSLLSRCADLEEIHFPSHDGINDDFITQSTMHPSSLPGLKVYHGPDFCAHDFTTDRPIRHMRLWASFDESRHPDDLISYLKRLNSGGELESLEISVQCVTKGLLEEICYSFPHLKALRITVDSMEYRNYGVYTREVRPNVHL
jgi:hypothetical protein